MQGATRLAADARLFVEGAESVAERVVLSGCVAVEGALGLLTLTPRRQPHLAGVVEALDALLLGATDRFIGVVGGGSELIRHQQSAALLEQLEVRESALGSDGDLLDEEVGFGEVDALVIFGVLRVEGEEGARCCEDAVGW